MRRNITLFEAHRWIARVRGRTDLDDASTEELIMLLAGNTLPSTGKRTMVAGNMREAIPAEAWENTLYEGVTPPPGTPDHVRFNSFSFIDGYGAGDGFGGALTLAGEDIPRWYGISVSVGDLNAALAADTPNEGSGLLTLEPPVTSNGQKRKQHASSGRKRGAKQRYDWMSFYAELARLIGEEGAPVPAGDPNWTQAIVETKMSEWCLRKWQKEPSESTIRAKVSGFLLTL